MPDNEIDIAVVVDGEPTVVRSNTNAPQLTPPAIITGVAFEYTNYDMQPPSVRLVDPFTAEPYRAKDLPTHLKRSVETAGPPMPGLQLPLGAQARFLAQQPLMQWYGP